MYAKKSRGAYRARGGSIKPFGGIIMSDKAIELIMLLALLASLGAILVFAV